MSNYSDEVGGANLFGGLSYSFVPDRFCTPNSAIYFNQGYLQVPQGIYFSGDFTVTAWILLKSYKSNSKLFDFRQRPLNDNVVLKMYQTTAIMYATVFNFTNYKASQTPPVINLNEWYFISFVLNGTTGHIYVNGNLTFM